MMDFSKPVLAALLGLTLAGCSESDTVVSVNIAYLEGVVDIDTVKITIEQDGQSDVVVDFDAPTLPLADGGTELDNSYYHRVTLTNSWKEEPANVVVGVFRGSKLLFNGEDTVTIQPEGAVAAFVKLGIEPMVEPTTEPATDAGQQPDAAVVDAGGGDTTSGTTGATDAGESMSDAAQMSDGGSMTDASDGGEMADGAVAIDSGVMSDAATEAVDGSLGDAAGQADADSAAQ